MNKFKLTDIASSISNDMRNCKVEQHVNEIHDMLIEHMNEDSASQILKKVQDIINELKH